MLVKDSGVTAKRKVGIMGGTFDPIHNGHMTMARQAALQASLECVLFMPTKIPPHKESNKITSESVRSQMVRLAVAGNNDFFSDLPREDEILLEGHKIMVTHGHNYGVSMDLYGVSEEAAARGCEIVCFGHTHKPVVEKKNGVLVINPGSLSFPRQEGRRPSYAVMELYKGEEPEIEIRYL